MLEEAMPLPAGLVSTVGQTQRLASRLTMCCAGVCWAFKPPVPPQSPHTTTAKQVKPSLRRASHLLQPLLVI
jgi:hypothetical protein